VAFAELEQFIDTQVRFYSSGMYTRLGFAVAVNVDPDVLLIDEVLAVGDEAFQRKCIDRVREFQREGRTIVFVTHAADMVRQLCESAAVLDHGNLVTHGTPGEAVRSYREHLLTDSSYGTEAANEAATPTGELSEQERRRTFQIRITHVAVEYPQSGDSYLLPDAPLVIRVDFESSITTDDVNFGIAIHDEEGRLMFGTSTRLQEDPVKLGTGPGSVTFGFPAVPLLDGTYLLTIGVTSIDEGTVYDWQEQQSRFQVMNPGRTTGRVSLPLSIELSQDAVDLPAR
jgi:ABC-2 type transport system ATP-binding protein